MRRLSFFVTPLLGLILGACGDARESFTGVYDLEGTIELRQGNASQTFETSSVTEVVADAFDSERIYLNFDCGLSGTMKDSQTFTLTPKGCPQFRDEDCWFKLSYTEGVVSQDAASSGLRLVGKGTYTVRCDDGTSERLSFSLAVSGEKRPASDTQPPSTGEMSPPSPKPRSAGLRALMRRLAK